MRGTLDPLTLDKIEAFARRRRRLILVRGLCAVLSILLGSMMVLAFVDWRVLLPDEVRWALSGAAYAAALAVAWITCMRYVWHAPDPRVLARFIEQVRPELREDLISAVELGDPRGRERWDSEEFREILQRSVAERMKGVEVPSLLSYRRIGPWIRAAVGVVSACGALLLVPGLRYDHLLLRSLLPMANLERLSRVKVSILEPNPPETVVPQNDTVTVRVETAGPETKSVFLEVFPQGRKAERFEMRPLGGRQYDSVIAVGREPVAYRIRAGDAITKKFLLSALPRPEAIAFHKTYVYPEYAEKPDRKVSEESGDLVELEGSTALLEVEVNQKVSSAELGLEQAGKSSVVRLQPCAQPRRMMARLPITASGTYRVRLVAAETRFDNKFSPQYEIRPAPDRVPRVSIDEPSQDQILPPLEVVPLRGKASDDVGLRRVLQLVRVNQEEWKETILADKPGLQLAVSRAWDLHDLGVKPGDQVTTKLVAIDLKGNRAESTPLHIEITAPGFDPQRHVPLLAKVAVFETLVELQDVARSLEKRVTEAAALAASDEIQRRQALLNALGESEQVTQQVDQVESRIKEALRLARAGRESADLVLEARLVRRLKEDTVQTSRVDIEKASSASDAAAAQGALKRAESACRRAAEQAAGAADAYREILATEVAIASLNDLKDLARDQAGINRQAAASLAARDPKVWERLQRRQGVAVKQVTDLEGLLHELFLRAPEGMNKRVQKMHQDLQAARDALKKALESPAGPALAGPSQAMQAQVEAVLGALHPLEQELGRRAEQARETLARRSDPSFADVSAAARAMRAVVEAERRLADLQDKAPPADRIEAQRVHVREQTERGLARWKAARVQLEARAGVEESRHDSDPFFVADSSLASRALQAVLDAHAAAPEAATSQETLLVVERAYRTLETGHHLAELSTSLRALAENERWPGGPSLGSTANAATRHPKDWQWMDVRLRTLAEDFAAAGLPVEAARDLQKAWRGPSGDAVRREMAERAQPGRKPVNAAPGLERLGSDAGKALTEIQPAMDAARKELLRRVPSLPERLAQLARAAEKLQQKTGALAEKTPQSEPAQVRPEARSLLENQQGLDRQIDDVMTELRRDANMQDLFTEKGRERSRDADDAVAMLQQAPPKAEDLLNQAAVSPQAPAQEKALARAAEQQGKLAEALKTLAEHYKNAEARKPEETRPELRKAEEALGLKPELDAKYAQMAKLAEMAQQSPEALRGALESQLSRNEAMQRQLEQLAQNALDRAEQALQQAAQMEQQAAQNLQNAQQQRASVAEQARKLAEEARRMAKQDIPQLAQEAQMAKADAQPPLAQAQRDLEKGANDVPQDFSNTNQAAQGLENAARDLQQAQQGLQQAQQRDQQAVKAAQAAAQQRMQQAQQAQQAAQQAQKESQAAQQAAQQQPKNPAVQQSAQEANQRGQAAEKAAQRANQQAQAAQQAQQQAQSAQQHAGEAAQHAAELAQQAQQLSNQLRQAAQAQQQAMGQSAQAQSQVAPMLQQAQADIQQAARDEAALGQAQEAQALDQVAQGVQRVGQREVPAARRSAQGENAAQAQASAQAAQQAIQAQAQALAQARAAAQGQPGQGQPAEGQPSPLSDAAAQFLAQALNSMNGQPGPKGQPEPGQGNEASQALSSAAQAQADSMREGRGQGQGQGRPSAQSQGQPGQRPGSQPFSRNPGTGKGASVKSGPLAEGDLPKGFLLKPGDWGKLPPRLARDLMEAQRESVSGEYRNMVETYFRVIAERAREKK